MDYFLLPWEMSFAPDVARYANNPLIAKNLRDTFPHPYTLTDAQEFISACQKADGESALLRAIVVNGEAVGSVGVFFKDDVYRKSCELGYWLAEPFWGKGIMSRAVSTICEEVFARFDIVRIFAEPYAYNTGSRRVLEKAGFVLEGVLRQSVFKNGAFFDSCIYAHFKHLPKEQETIDIPL